MVLKLMLSIVWRNTVVKRISLCEAGSYHSTAAPAACLSEPEWMHRGLGGLLPPCFPFLWVHLQGLTHLPHISDMAEISVIAGLG